MKNVHCVGCDGMNENERILYSIELHQEFCEKMSFENIWNVTIGKSSINTQYLYNFKQYRWEVIELMRIKWHG